MAGGASPAAPAAGRLAGVGQAARCPRAGLRAGRRGRRAVRPGGQEPVRVRASRAGRVRRRPARRLRVLRRRRAQERAGPAGCRPAGDRPPGSACSTEGDWSFLWVVDAPLFEPSSDATASGDVAVGAGAWTAVHHAFTSPEAGVLRHLRHRPRQRAGLRLRHRLQRQRDRRRLDPYPPARPPGAGVRRDGPAPEQAQEKFGFLLDAFAYGAPPHGGIAFGWDRICALLSGTDSIRDVIAFPKTGGGYDPLTEAPAPITPEQRKEAGVDATPVLRGAARASEAAALPTEPSN